MSFRRDRQGKWCFYGPTTEIDKGPTIATRGDGQQRIAVITGLSNPFLVDKVMMRYGYIEDQKAIRVYEPKEGKHYV